MQGIYLTNNINENPKYQILEDQLKKFPKIVVGKYLLNFFFTEKRESFFKEGNNFIFNLGVFIYKNNFNKKALSLFMQDLASGIKLKDLLLSKNTRGQFILVLYYQNRLQIITDRLGYFPLYYFQKGDKWSFSNSMLTLAKNNKVTLNYIGIAQYLSENYRHITYACCDQNIFNEINYLKAGTIYFLLEDKVIEEKYFDIKNQISIGRYTSTNQIVADVENTLTENLSFLKNISGKIHCDITGGIDTRVIIGILSKMNINFEVGVQAIEEYKDFSNQGKFSEISIVNEIIKYKKLNFELFSEEKYSKNSKFIEDLTFLYSHKQTYNRRTGYFLDVRNKNADIMISGLSGTELFRLSYYKYFKKNKDLKLNSFLEKHDELVDLMHDKLMHKKTYYDHLINFYQENLNGLKYKKARDLSSYIDYFAFYRTHFCRYLSLANSFVPFYTPYGDYSFASLMYQVAYDAKAKFKIQRFLLSRLDPRLASFYSTRGFPLAKVDFFNFYKFFRMIKKDIPQQYFSINQKFNTYVYKNLIKFFFKNKNTYYSFYKNKFNSTKATKKNLWNIPNDINVIKDLDELLKKDLPVFEIIDKKKLANYTRKDCNYNTISRVVNLNRILDYVNY